MKAPIHSLDHLVLIIKNVQRTKKFYSLFLGSPIHQDKDSIVYQIGTTKLFLGTPYSKIKNNHFHKDRIGLNHLAFAVRNMKELTIFQKKLDKNKIKNSGIIPDKFSGNPFVWFDDPDGIRLEFYLRK